MNTRLTTTKKNHTALWFVYSLILHSIGLMLILLTLSNTQLFQEEFAKNHEALVIIKDEPTVATTQTTKNPQAKKTPAKPAQTQEIKKEEKQDTFNVPIPVMYYGNSLDQNRTPGMPSQDKNKTEKIVKEPYEKALIGAIPSANPQDTQAHPMPNSLPVYNTGLLTLDSKLETLGQTPYEEDKKNISHKQENAPKLAQKKKRIPLRKQEVEPETLPAQNLQPPSCEKLGTTALTNMPTDNQTDTPMATEEDTLNAFTSIELKSKTLSSTAENAQKEEQKKEQAFTLADLFKNIPNSSVFAPDTAKSLATYNPRGDSSLIGDGYGSDIVITEGDMRYYSVWKKFLHHINETAQYNQIRHKQDSTQWRQKGLIKNPSIMSVTVAKNGTCLAVTVLHSSGCTPFDTFNVQTAWSASPYPPLPESMGKEQARFEIMCR